MLLALGVGPLEIMIVLVVVLLLFGKRLPDLMRSLGKSLTEFKKGVNDKTDENPPAQP